MVTRREVLGAGLAFASASSATVLNSVGRDGFGMSQTGLPKVGAMILDERLGVSKTSVDFLRSRRPDLPFRTIRLDAKTVTELKLIFDRTRLVAGISYGATLFCLERIAWDHGYRVARRTEYEFNARAASARENDATILAIAGAIVSGEPRSSTAATTLVPRAYRPSRTDDTLHAWVMQTAGASRQRPSRQEIRG